MRMSSRVINIIPPSPSMKGPARHPFDRAWPATRRMVSQHTEIGVITA